MQYDYIACYLDMYEGSKTNYQTARKLSKKYNDNPVCGEWNKMFKNVYDTLNAKLDDDSDISTKADEISFNTTVVNEGKELKISIPANTKIVVNLYQINLELYFSEFPFEKEVTTFSAVKPSQALEFDSLKDFRTQVVKRDQFNKLKDVIVEIYEYKKDVPAKKVSNIFWVNPDIKVKISENEGMLKVFYDGKILNKCYCKVYSKGGKGNKFYKDGYTDISASFRYALDVSNITEFSILIMTEHGGIIHQVKPPSIY